MTGPLRIVACLSGGVDSSVAAALLRRAGHEVIGVFMRSGASGQATGEKQGCCSVEDALDARGVADRLGVPFYALNMADEFGRLIDRFASDYARGLTPNPCVLCNRWLKLGHVLRFARSIGATHVATGHYARRVEVAGRVTVERPRDRQKDQSYVLALLEQEQLERALFPLADLTKPEVRALARELGLDRVAAKAESQEVCFVPDDYRDVLRARLPAHEPALQAGEVQDEAGRVLGEHAGTAGFTIGQRKGIGVAAAQPLFVLRTDPARRLVVVGPRDGLTRTWLVARDTTWLVAHLRPGERCRGRVQVRAHGASFPATLEAGADEVVAHFDAPVRQAVVPGQAAVVYDEADERVLAAGWIAAAGEGAVRAAPAGARA